MRIHAYVLAADPTWVYPSVRSYYEHVDRIVISYDEEGRGWTGSPLKLEESFAALRAIDVEKKMVWIPGQFSRSEETSESDFVQADTRQRRAALQEAGIGADWVLQIDTDEVLPDWGELARALTLAEKLELAAVEWPMRVLYRRRIGGGFLMVVGPEGQPHFEYPGPIAVRPTVELVDCRRTTGQFLRPVVTGDESSAQIAAPRSVDEHRISMLSPDAVIWHNSWARSPTTVRRKIASWSHNQGARSWFYYFTTWLPAPLVWRSLRRFHPLNPPLWPRLEATPPLPFDLEGRR